MEELVLILLESSSVHVLEELRELSVRRILMIVISAHVSMEVSVLIKWEASPVSAELASLDQGARETSTSVCPIPAHTKEPQTASSCSTTTSATASQAGAADTARRGKSSALTTRAAMVESVRREMMDSSAPAGMDSLDNAASSEKTTLVW